MRKLHTRHTFAQRERERERERESATCRSGSWVCLTSWQRLLGIPCLCGGLRVRVTLSLLEVNSRLGLVFLLLTALPAELAITWEGMEDVGGW